MLGGAYERGDLDWCENGRVEEEQEEAGMTKWQRDGKGGGCVLARFLGHELIRGFGWWVRTGRGRVQKH
jgi:hypothetical protein